MKFAAAALAVLGMISASAHAADDDLRVFKPSGQWTADFGDDYCRLSRTFANGDDQVSLALERIQPTSFAKLILLGDGIKIFRGGNTLGYRLIPSTEDRKAPLFRAATADGRQLLYLDPVSFGAPAPQYDAAAEQDSAAKIEGLLLTDGTVEPVRIETGSLKAPIGYLQDCTYDLLSYWGIDGQKHRKLTSAVVPEDGTTLPGGTIGFADFPKLAGGANQVRLMIDAAGKPTSCTIMSPSLDETINAKICKHLMDKAKFKPALDADGQPLASYWIQSPSFMTGFGGT